MIRKILPNLYVGNDAGIEDHLNEKGWSCCVAAKEPYHRRELGYETRGANPSDPEYLWARRKDNLFMNLIDADDPNFIPVRLVREALDFITERLDAGDKVLVACNHGHSRSPSLILMWMQKYEMLPRNAESAIRKFRKNYYPEYQPKAGMRGTISKLAPTT